MALDLSGFFNVLEEDVYNGEMGHAQKHNVVNDQVNFLTEQLVDGPIIPVAAWGFGDGTTGDAEALEAALLDVPDGAKLAFPAGTYQLDYVITLVKRIHFVGQGTTLTAAPGLNGWIEVPSVASGSSFDGITFDSNDVARGVIYGTAAHDISITNCTFRGYSDVNGGATGDAAIKVGLGTGWKITGNTFDNWGGDIALLNRAIALNDSSCRDCLVSDNVFRNARMGIVVVGQGHTISGNVFRDCTDNAIYLTTSSVEGIINRDITISGNTMMDCEEGVVIAGSGVETTEWTENITVADNVFRDWTVRGLAIENRVRNLTIVGNTFSNEGAAPGVYIGLRSAQSATHLTENVTIIGNTLRGTTGYAAVWLQNLKRVLIHDNVIDIVPTGANQHLIRIQQDGKNISVRGNALRASGDHAASAYLLRHVSGTATDCKQSGNVTEGGLPLAVAGYATDVNGHGNAVNTIAGAETLPRAALSGGATLSAGVLWFTYFTAADSAVVTKIASATRGTAAAGATLARMGLYRVDSEGRPHLEASCASDTTLWTATNSYYERALTSSYTLIPGQRYAIGLIIVGASTAPLLLGVAANVAGVMALEPRQASAVTSQTDLPSSVSPPAATSSAFWAAVLP